MREWILPYQGSRRSTSARRRDRPVTAGRKVIFEYRADIFSIVPVGTGGNISHHARRKQVFRRWILASPHFSSPFVARASRCRRNRAHGPKDGEGVVDTNSSGTNLDRRRLDVVLEADAAAGPRLRHLERLREQLMGDGAGGDTVLEGLLDRYRPADRQRLRQLVRGARMELGGGSPGRHHRSLLRHLRELMRDADAAEP